MGRPHGPHVVAKNGQVVIPKAVLDEAGLAPGEAVYFVALSEPPGTLLILPTDAVSLALEPVLRSIGSKR